MYIVLNIKLLACFTIDDYHVLILDKMIYFVKVD